MAFRKNARSVQGRLLVKTIEPIETTTKSMNMTVSRGLKERQQHLNTSAEEERLIQKKTQLVMLFPMLCEMGLSSKGLAQCAAVL